MMLRVVSFLAFSALVAAAPAGLECEETIIDNELDELSMLQKPRDEALLPGSLHTRVVSFLQQESLKPSAVLAEFIAMTLFVMVGVGSAMGVANEPGWVLQVSLSFGFGITALAYSVGPISGGQINPAVTFGLVLGGKCSFLQGCFNVAAQLLGSVLGAYLLTWMIPEEQDKTGGLGTNAVAPSLKKVNACVAEIFGTFLLVFVVYQTAVSPLSEPSRVMACLAIGLAVFLAHCVLIPIDGCSINPARSFGPALVRKLRYSKNADADPMAEMWIYTVCPLVGSALAVMASVALA